LRLSPELTERVLALARESGTITEARPIVTPAELAASEKDFQDEVEKLARRCGWKVYHTRDSRKSAVGFPDLVALRPPRSLIAELKIPPNTPTAEQQTWLELFEACGWDTRVWVPADWSLIEETFR
jgi:ribosomal protein L37E